MGPPRHVCIIGAGINGALIAHELLQAGVQVTILEAREKGAGSSSRSAAAIRQQFSTPSTVQAMIYSLRRYERFAEDFACDEQVTEMLVQNGYLFLYERPELCDDPVAAAALWDSAGRNVEMQRACGVRNVALLSPAELVERFPHVCGERLIGASFCPTDGFLRPDVIYMEGFRRVVELGGVLRQKEAVVGGVIEGGRLVGVRTSKDQELRADLFVNATNAWAGKLSTLLGGSDLKITAVKRYLYFLQRGGDTSAQQLTGWPMMIGANRAYCRPENGEQLMMGRAHVTGGSEDFDWEDQDRIEPDFFHKSGLDNYGMRLWMDLARSVPALADFAGLSATTAGFYGVTPDHNPYFGFDPALPGLLHAAGFSGHGAMMGPFTGKVIAEMALAGRTIRSVAVDGMHIDLDDLLVGRTSFHAEGMVI